MVSATLHATPAPDDERSSSIVSPFTAPALPHLASSPPPLDVMDPTSAPEPSVPAPWEVRVPGGLAKAGGVPDPETSRPGRLSVLTPVPLGSSPSADAEDTALMSEVTTPADSEVEGPWSSAASSPVDGHLATSPLPPDDDANDDDALCQEEADDDEAEHRPVELSRTASAAATEDLEEDEAAAADDDADEDEGGSLGGEASDAEAAVFALLALQGRMPSHAPAARGTPSEDAAEGDESEGRAANGLFGLVAPPAPPPTHVTGAKRRASDSTFAFGTHLASMAASGGGADHLASSKRARASPVPRSTSSASVNTCGDFKYICMFDGCGKSYASTDAVRKHCRQRHLEWLRGLGHGCPALYCRWEPA